MRRYWGRILGVTLGLLVPEPWPLRLFAALLGYQVGSLYDGRAIRPRLEGAGRFLHPARIAALFGRRQQVFAIAVTVLAAKLAKCDGPVTPAEIEAFKQHFRIPPASLRQIGTLFNEAKATPAGFESYADLLGETFADHPGVLEDVLAALFAIARADQPLNGAEGEFLARVHQGFRLSRAAWERARTAFAGPRGSGAGARADSSAHSSSSSSSARSAAGAEDPYAVLGVAATASDGEVRAAWVRLMREHHPDSLRARGVPEDFIARAAERAARINAAWDLIKRERGL
jgi:DnaJ like chaperone protein